MAAAQLSAIDNVESGLSRADRNGLSTIRKRRLLQIRRGDRSSALPPRKPGLAFGGYRTIGWSDRHPRGDLNSPCRVGQSPREVGGHSRRGRDRRRLRRRRPAPLTEVRMVIDSDLGASNPVGAMRVRRLPRSGSPSRTRIPNSPSSSSSSPTRRCTRSRSPSS